MKNMVSVPLTFSSPWQRRLNSSLQESIQRAPSLHLLSSMYSASCPVSGLKAFPWRAKWSRNGVVRSMAGAAVVAAATWWRR